MRKGFIQRGADGITRQYDGNGNVISFGQKGSDGLYRRFDRNGNVKAFNYGNSSFDNQGRRKRNLWR